MILRETSNLLPILCVLCALRSGVVFPLPRSLRMRENSKGELEQHKKNNNEASRTKKICVRKDTFSMRVLRTNIVNPDSLILRGGFCTLHSNGAKPVPRTILRLNNKHTVFLCCFLFFFIHFFKCIMKNTQMIRKTPKTRCRQHRHARRGKSTFGDVPNGRVGQAANLIYGLDTFIIRHDMAIHYSGFWVPHSERAALCNMREKRCP